MMSDIRRRLLVGALGVFAWHGAAMAEVIYDSIPAPAQPNYPSLGYQATQTSEFGDYIRFGGTQRNLTNVTLTLSSWALQSNNSGFGDATGFDHNLTLNLYNVVNNAGTPAIGSLIVSETITAHILWRPEASAGCGTAYRAGDGNCYNGLAFNVVFDLTDENITLPEEVIFGLAFNTQTYGANPLGVDGPYNSLNFAVPETTPTVGTDVNPNATFWNTANGGNLTNPANVNTFSQDTGWAPNVPAARFEAPEPGTLVLLGTGLSLIALRRRRMS